MKSKFIQNVCDGDKKPLEDADNFWVSLNKDSNMLSIGNCYSKVDIPAEHVELLVNSIQGLLVKTDSKDIVDYAISGDAL